MICNNCKNSYEKFMLFNYNLDLCQDCFDTADINYDFDCDKVTHKITCPKCGRVYDFIVDKKCETKNCPVWFFWDERDNRVIARWREQK